MILAQILFLITIHLNQIEPSYNHKDAELIASILYSECRGESREGQKMIAQCIVNRVEEGYWGNDIESVITSKNQFANPGPIKRELYNVAKEVLQGNMFDSSKIILYFRATNQKKDWYEPYINHIGNHAYYGRELENK